MDWESGVYRCKLLPLEWMSNETLRSPGSSIQSLSMERDGGASEKKNAYDWVTLLYSRN